MYRTYPMYHRLINDEDTNDNSRNYESFEFKNRSTKTQQQDLAAKTSNGTSKQQSRNNSPSGSSFINLNHYDIIEYEIQTNDTLQGIALRFDCTISQLRILNQLMSDQDFFKLKSIRIPVIKHGLLTESSNIISFNNEPRTQFVNDLVDISSNNESQSSPLPAKTQVINIGISKYLSNADNDNNNEDHDLDNIHNNYYENRIERNQNYKKFLQNLSTDIEEMRKFNESKQTTSTNDIDSSDDVDRLKTSSSSTTNKDDFGIQWKYLIFIIIFICLFIPLYILYRLENNHHHHYYHHFNSDNHNHEYHTPLPNDIDYHYHQHSDGDYH